LTSCSTKANLTAEALHEAKRGTAALPFGDLELVRERADDRDPEPALRQQLRVGRFRLGGDEALAAV